MSFQNTFSGQHVLVTGHTGFKGSWLCEWLLSLGAKVTGFALSPPTEPALFDQLGLENRMEHRLGDVRNPDQVLQAVKETKPAFVFHLAAQSLVRLSYHQPVETYATNVMGTAHVLEAIRNVGLPCTVIAVTTDKCYQNQEWVHSYREVDPLGGHDPYSSSKGAAELIIAGYRNSYFSTPDSPIRLASVRAGNVIGGGDWAQDRIIPDCIRSLMAGRSIPVRNKIATRPWQHVLEPLSGYLQLASAIHQASIASDRERLHSLCGAFNFGPALTSNRTVAALVQEVLKHWPGRWEDQSDPHALHEATLLNLATDKAHHHLGWQPAWNFEQTIRQTIGWYRGWSDAPHRARDLTLSQISEYSSDAAAACIPWISQNHVPA